MNTEAFHSVPEPLTVVCGYDEGSRQFTIYGVYGPEVPEQTLQERYGKRPHVRLLRQFKNMYQPHVAFTLKTKTGNGGDL
jgi:hypothetical protein